MKRSKPVRPWVETEREELGRLRFRVPQSQRGYLDGVVIEIILEAGVK
jgi:hypothetical protein